MKNIIYKSAILTLTAVVAIGATSCRKQLFQEPFTSLSPASAFNSVERVEKASVGMYDQLQNANWFGGRVLIYADVRSLDASISSYFAPLPTYTQVTSNNAYSTGGWAGAYRTIGEANLFLKNLAGATGVPTAKLDQYTGEAKFIRALNYFYLVNHFAQPYGFSAGATHLGVPLVLTSSDSPFDPSNQVARATVAAVYAQIEADLTDAEAKLPLNYNDAGFSNVARATKGAAQALLARTFLYENKFASAVAAADRVIANTQGYTPNPDPLTAFRTFTTKESIFSVAMNGADNPNTNNALGQHYGSGRRGDINAATDYVALFEPQDLRLKNLIEKTGTTTAPLYWTLKYLGTSDWVPVLRITEIYLIKAEALANLAAGTIADPNAILLLKQVRDRSLASVLAPATKADLLTAIYAERRRELGFEGQGIFDFLRTGRDIPAHGVAPAQTYGSDYVILPIPLYDLQKNPNLKPNPGY